MHVGDELADLHTFFLSFAPFARPQAAPETHLVVVVVVSLGDRFAAFFSGEPPFVSRDDLGEISKPRRGELIASLADGIITFDGTFELASVFNERDSLLGVTVPGFCLLALGNGILDTFGLLLALTKRETSVAHLDALSSMFDDVETGRSNRDFRQERAAIPVVCLRVSRR